LRSTAILSSKVSGRQLTEEKVFRHIAESGSLERKEGAYRFGFAASPAKIFNLVRLLPRKNFQSLFHKSPRGIYERSSRAKNVVFGGPGGGLKPPRKPVPGRVRSHL
jgi:hypothetical protein